VIVKRRVDEGDALADGDVHDAEVAHDVGDEAVGVEGYRHRALDVQRGANVSRVPIKGAIFNDEAEAGHYALSRVEGAAEGRRVAAECAAVEADKCAGGSKHDASVGGAAVVDEFAAEAGEEGGAEDVGDAAGGGDVAQEKGVGD
jgi:hypothetical protein